MAYADKEDYFRLLHRTIVPDDDFFALANAASDIIDSIVTVEIDEETAKSEEVKKATVYQIEMLYLNGGVSALVGQADCTFAGSESLGGYSVSGGNTSASKVLTKDGIPISSLTISQLRKAGLMSRWAYAGRRDDYAE